MSEGNPLPCVDCITLAICKSKYRYYKSRHPTDKMVVENLFYQYTMDKCNLIKSYFEPPCENFPRRVVLFEGFFSGDLIVTNWGKDEQSAV